MKKVQYSNYFVFSGTPFTAAEEIRKVQNLHSRRNSVYYDVSIIINIEKYWYIYRIEYFIALRFEQTKFYIPYTVDI